MSNNDNLITDGYDAELTQFVASWMDRLSIGHDGTVVHIKAFVKNKHNLKIFIYPNDHNPPHFHIHYGAEIATYKFSKSGPLIKWNGNIPKKTEKKIIHMYEMGLREKLVSKWNETRPSDKECDRIP